MTLWIRLNSGFIGSFRSFPPQMEPFMGYVHKSRERIETFLNTNLPQIIWVSSNGFKDMANFIESPLQQRDLELIFKVYKEEKRRNFQHFHTIWTHKKYVYDSHLCTSE